MEKLAMIIQIPGYLDAEDDLWNVLDDDDKLGDFESVIRSAAARWIWKNVPTAPLLHIEVKVKRIVGILLVEPARCHNDHTDH